MEDRKGDWMWLISCSALATVVATLARRLPYAEVKLAEVASVMRQRSIHCSCPAPGFKVKAISTQHLVWELCAQFPTVLRLLKLLLIGHDVESHINFVTSCRFHRTRASRLPCSLKKCAATFCAAVVPSVASWIRPGWPLWLRPTGTSTTQRIPKAFWPTFRDHTICQPLPYYTYYTICQQNRQKKQPLQTATMRYLKWSIVQPRNIPWDILVQIVPASGCEPGSKRLPPELLLCKYSQTRSAEPHYEAAAFLWLGPGNNKMLEHAAVHDNILFGHFRHPVKIVKSVAQDCMPNKLGSAILMTRKRIHLSWYTKINSSSTSRSLVIITLIRSQRLWLWAALGVLQTATVFFFFSPAPFSRRRSRVDDCFTGQSPGNAISIPAGSGCACRAGRLGQSQALAP